MCPPANKRRSAASPGSSPKSTSPKRKRSTKKENQEEELEEEVVGLKAVVEEAMPLPEVNRMGRFIGAHISAAGGLFHAFENTKRINGAAMALFLKSQRQWEAKPLEVATIQKFKETAKLHNFDMSKILPHGSYLVNMGNPDEEKRAKSYGAFLDELKRCEELGIGLYNIHPGSTVGECTVKESIGFIADCINRAHAATSTVTVVIENMAGQGNVIGGKFEHLRDIISLVNDKSRVGVCIDTCHLFAAGYDIRSSVAYQKTMAKFEEIVGFQYLKALHLNDSMTECGSGKDRHENIGKGKIGLKAFEHLMNDERLVGIPMVLETPLCKTRGEQVYREEIELLYSLIGKDRQSSA